MEGRFGYKPYAGRKATRKWLEEGVTRMLLWLSCLFSIASSSLCSPFPIIPS